MTQAVSGFRAREEFLNKGKMTPVLANVLRFVGLPESAEMPRINKTFHRATQELQGNVCSQLGRTQNAIVITAQARDVSCEAELEGVWGELNEAGTRVNVQLRSKDTSSRGHQRAIFERYWEKLADLKRSAMQERAPDQREARMHSLLAHLQPLREQLVATNQYLEQYHLGVRGGEDPVPRLLAEIERGVAFENVSERLHSVIAERGLNPQGNSSACLAALSEKQRAAAAYTPFHLREFVKTAGLPAFSPERFIAAERVAVAAEVAGEEDHLHFWEAIMREFNRLNIAVLEGEMPHTPPEILRWLDDAANQDRLDRIVYLSISGLRHLPSQIGKLRNLTELYCRGQGEGRQLSTLPAELGNLEHLRDLGLWGNLLEEIPAAVRDLHQLQLLNLYDNRIQEIPLFLTELHHLWLVNVGRNAIRVLPDAIFRHVESSFSFLDLPGSGITIDRENLTHIPFRLWFKEKFNLSLTNLDLNGFEYILYGLLGLPLFIYNFLLMEVVERIVTIFRDEYGYDRMVEVDPQLAELRRRVAALVDNAPRE